MQTTVLVCKGKVAALEQVIREDDEIMQDRSPGERPSIHSNPSYENQGIGKKLIQYVENRAREMDLTEIISLSTQAFTYFQSKGGFVEGTPEDLPPARREKYEQSGRNSKVLVKRLM